MRKIILSKEQAEAIKLAIADYGSDQVMDEFPNGFKWAGSLAPLNELHASELARALYIGYEVEQTPEDRLHEYYMHIEKMKSKYGLFSEERMRYLSEEVGMRKTLDILGITIEGINAKEDE